jgi:uncharacterized protein YecE (DUF72 family)
VELLIGTAGFSYKDWEGIVYPKDLNQRKLHKLQYLARFFDCCEINTSFYGHIQPKAGKHWCDMVAEVNPAFQFTAKLNKAFTHAPGAAVQPTSAASIHPLPEDEKLARAGLDVIAKENRLGGLLAQFPISFKNTPENRDYLRSLIARFKDYPLAIEIRHATWDQPEVLAELTQLGVGFVNIDQPRLGRSLRATTHTTSSIGYVRLHGRNYKQWFEAERSEDRYNYLYKPSELAPWKEKIDEITRQAEKTFVIANNHYKGKAAVNALELKQMFSKKKVRAPATLVKEYPDLLPIADAE